MKKNGFSSLLAIAIVFLASALILLVVIIIDNPSKVVTDKVVDLTKPPSPTPIANYQPPKLANSEAYTIIFVGDSMVAALGENFDELRKSLSEYYPNTVFGLFNYGFGSTNILSAYGRFVGESIYLGKNYQAILDREMDIVILGSFGYNPLSEQSLEAGLTRQKKELDKIVLKLVAEKPNDIIIFLADIAPSLDKFAKGVIELSDEERSKWAIERRAYIENFIEYANSHNIPLINMYEKSLDENGNAIYKYINTNDNIHPSHAGIKFISDEIASYLWEENIVLEQ